MALVSDSAIHDFKDDVLERSDFTNNIAHLIVSRKDKEAFTIGIIGAWGSGKTSILNLIDSQIKTNNQDVITIFFNPWRYSGENELLMSFFNCIAGALDKNLETGGELVKKFFKKHTEKVGSLISVMAGDPTNSSQSVATWLSSFLKTSELDDFKLRVQELLIEKKKKVVIYIDDIDRLPRKEIQDLFKVIKLLGDFDHVTYILAFDKQVVTQALGEVYSFDKSATFLEKIIQLQIEVPLINKKILLREWKKSLDRVLKNNSIEFNNAQWFELQTRIQKGFLQNLDDLRKIKNIENSLSYVLPILNNKVNIVDLITIESMRFFYPNLYLALKYKKVDIFDEYKDLNMRIFLFGSSEKQKERTENRIAEFYKITCLKEIANYEGVLSVLKDLFPTLKNMLTGSDFGIESSDIKTKLKIGSKDYFDRYFTYSLNPMELPESVIKELLLNGNDNTNLVKGLDDLLGGFDHYQIINKIFLFIELVEDKKKLIIQLLNFYNKFNTEYYDDGFFTMSNRERFLRNIFQVAESNNLILVVFSDNSIISKMEDELFVDCYTLVRRHTQYNNEIKNSFLMSLVSRITNNKFNILKYSVHFEISSLIDLLKQSEDFNVESYLNEKIKNEEDIYTFLTSFCSFINGERVIKFDQEILKNIHKAYSYISITGKIKKICPHYFSKKSNENAIEKYLIARDLPTTES